MPRLDVAPDYRLLVSVLREPRRLESLTPFQWSRVMDAAEQARLLGWLLNHAGPGVPNANAPGWLKDRFVSAFSTVAEYDRAVLWEIDRLDRAFSGCGLQWVLLKGAAYLAAGLPPGRGRRVADIDVLVPEAELPVAEEALKRHGWGFAELEPYDERFYREWMHELPPMVHGERSSVVDLHHGILPKTSRLHPSTARLLERSVVVAPGVRVLCPSHMVAHAAAHLFHDGEIAGAIRDLVDLDGLLRPFHNDVSFWRELAEESRALGLTRPTYYALRYTKRLLNTPIPAEFLDEISTWAPASPVVAVMDALVGRTVHSRAGPGTSVPALALYIRSHWLRMPPLLLARHLLRKGTRRE